MSVSGAFDKLSKKRKDAVRLVFEHNLTNGEIAKKIGVGESTIRRWKKDPAFIHALHDYSLNKLNNALPLAIQQAYELLENPKTSAMVKFQLIQMLFKYANLLSDNSTPELDKARIRKANADARVAEAKAKAMEDNGQDMEQLVDKMLDTLTKEDKKNGGN